MKINLKFSFYNKRNMNSNTTETYKYRKTRMCNSIDKHIDCKHANCKFAHSQEELDINKCSFGDNCRYIKKIGNVYYNNTKYVKICYRLHEDEKQKNFEKRIIKQKDDFQNKINSENIIYSGFMAIISSNNISNKLATECTKLCKNSKLNEKLEDHYKEVDSVINLPFSSYFKDNCEDIRNKEEYENLNVNYPLSLFEKLCKCPNNIKNSHSMLAGVESNEEKYRIPHLTLPGGRNNGNEEPDIVSRRECEEEIKIKLSDELFSLKFQTYMRQILNITEFKYTINRHHDNKIKGMMIYIIILPDDVIININKEENIMELSLPNYYKNKYNKNYLYDYKYQKPNTSILVDDNYSYYSSKNLYYLPCNHSKKIKLNNSLCKNFILNKSQKYPKLYTNSYKKMSEILYPGFIHRTIII